MRLHAKAIALEWEHEQRKLGNWKDVHALDADDIEQWMEQAPGVASWFAGQTGAPHQGIDDMASRWHGIATSTRKPLKPQVFLVSRDETQKQVREWLAGNPRELMIESRSPTEVIDFFCATLEAMDEPEKLAYLSRSVIVENATALRMLRDSCFPAILVIDPSVELSSEDVGRAVAHGHHVLLAVEPQAMETGNPLQLERASEFNLAQALETCGFSPVEAEQFARASGGSLAILKRRLARSRTQRTNALAGVASQGAIYSCLLLGGWDGANAADRKIIETIAGRPYSELEPDFQRLAICRDPLLLHAAGSWRVLSKDEAWSMLGDHVTASNLQQFATIAVEVLIDDDPKFELPEKDRMFAIIKGKVPRFSQTLKAQVAQTVAFLGAFGDKLDVAASVNISAAMDHIVSDVLSPNASWHRWASIGAQLSLLAEASPRSFLQAVQEGLRRAEPELLKLFRETGAPPFSSCNHAGLLWALETLAWSKQFLLEICRALLQLTEICTRGRWANQPDATLSEILCAWMPQTMANVDERIKVLDAMIADRPQAAWKILLGLLPQPGGETSLPTHRPMWRDWANPWTRGATPQDWSKFVTAVAERVIQQADGDANRWKQVYEKLFRLPTTIYKQLIAATEQLARSGLSDSDRRLVSDELSEQIARHRQFADANWSMPPEILSALESQLSQLKPVSCVLRHAWLFERWPDRFHENRSGKWDENLAALEHAREDAVREIVDELGFAGIQSLIAEAAAPDAVGMTLAATSSDNFVAEIIPGQISLGSKAIDFAKGFIWNRFRKDGWSWVDGAIARCATDAERALLFTVLPFEPETWNRAKNTGDRVQKLYWQTCRPWSHGLNTDAFQSAVESLTEYVRPADAIGLLSMAIHEKKDIRTEILLLPMESLLYLSGDIGFQQAKFADPYSVAEVIAALQERTDIELSRLIRIEWNFLSYLEQPSNRAPKTLHRHLCDSPAFFVEVLSVLYRSKNEPRQVEQQRVPDERRAATANRAWQLLHDWKLLPGTKADGSIDEQNLRSWCDEARRLAAAGGRTEVCDNHLGQLFIHAPGDGDGKWPCDAVRRLVESIATESLASGLDCGIHNSRGVVWRGKGGDQERELVAKYRRQAEQIRFDAPFTANVLDGVADSYEAEARRWDEEERWGESG